MQAESAGVLARMPYRYTTISMAHTLLTGPSQRERKRKRKRGRERKKRGREITRGRERNKERGREM